MGYIWMICLVAACGGLLFGYDWVVIGGAKPFYEAYFAITDPAQSGWAMSSALVGCVLGAAISGWTADRFGRKKPLLLAAILFTISAWGTAAAGNFDLFVVYRIIGGIGIGLASALSPMYIAEISPADKRGKFVAINQLTIVLGVLAAQLVNLMIADPVASNATEEGRARNRRIEFRFIFEEPKLRDEEVRMIDETLKSIGAELVCTPPDEEAQPYFTRYPLFGLPTEVEDCVVIIKGS